MAWSQIMCNLFLVLAVLASAQSPAGEQITARTIEIAAGDNMKYSISIVEARPGETLRIVLSVFSKFPKKTMAHNVVVLDKGVNASRLNAAAAAAPDREFIPPDRTSEVVAHTGLAGAGETVEVTFTVPRATGDYQFICTFPGHYRLGMKGTLRVR